MPEPTPRLNLLYVCIVIGDRPGLYGFGSMTYSCRLVCKMRSSVDFFASLKSHRLSEDSSLHHSFVLLEVPFQTICGLTLNSPRDDTTHSESLDNIFVKLPFHAKVGYNQNVHVFNARLSKDVVIYLFPH